MTVTEWTTQLKSFVFTIAFHIFSISDYNVWSRGKENVASCYAWKLCNHITVQSHCENTTMCENKKHALDMWSVSKHGCEFILCLRVKFLWFWFGLGLFFFLSSFSSSAHAHGLIRALGLLKWSAQILLSLLHYDAGWTGWLFRPSWTQTKHWGCRFNTWEFGFVCRRMNRNTFPGFGDAFTHESARLWSAPTARSCAGICMSVNSGVGLVTKNRDVCDLKTRIWCFLLIISIRVGLVQFSQPWGVPLFLTHLFHDHLQRPNSFLQFICVWWDS